MGAFIRREKRKRLYRRYFTETSFLRKLQLSYNYHFGRIHKEPPVQTLPNGIYENDLFVFNKVITDNDLFGALRNHKDLILDELNKIITPRINNLLQKYQPPVIGIHIRRGDFKIANPITANEFFIKGINLIREAAGTNLPVTIFTDADESEIQDLLALPETYITEPKPDIVDILLLSKSKIMLLSQSSSFSYWGAFFSDAIVIRPADDWQNIIKNDNAKSGYGEIKWDHKDDLSTKQFVKKLNLNNKKAD